ncbi:30S ribosomal protein S9, related [Neospora caninum Liverpool]|uniref:30S ribosomal protein S9, related n=1 Tax=Neospora caninum (strain Liverpool) TaxID=572307 RepID=F0VPT1_NEOCL|nr:30S ribosomal protein S9, related [Neospora caninum Liverpool]CBZ55728.1 30S ribosomal protein S9, related [Neospora caninum Liverpool]CEL70470.1 TPA: 30S ribosomal protein S9, related [Neospora caninum Liverpool]|eukprot:XP_003885754.1 30S ribosomal protein S9, related [Neospora caninum Liverpool]
MALERCCRGIQCSLGLRWAVVCLACLLCGPAVGTAFIIPQRSLQSFQSNSRVLPSVGRWWYVGDTAVKQCNGWFQQPGRSRRSFPGVVDHGTTWPAVIEGCPSFGDGVLHGIANPSDWMESEPTELGLDATPSSVSPELPEPGPQRSSFSWGTRKRSYARVQLPPGSGKLTINNRDAVDYLQDNPWWIHNCIAPLMELQLENEFDVIAEAHGGGLGGQSGAIMLAVAREIVRQRPELRPPLRRAGFLTVDARKVERKKFGLRKARKKEQYSKR